MSHDQIPVLTAIRQQLVDGISRSTSARQRRAGPLLRVGPAGAMLILVVLAAVALVVAVPAFRAPSDPAPAAFALARLPDGRIHVTVAPGFDQAQRLQRALQDAGVNVQVIRITAHPMFVGTIEFPSHQLDPQGVRRGRGEFWLDPARFGGTVEMLIYVAAAPGQEWQQAPSVFHPAEPLGGLPCAVDGPMDPAALERWARSVGLRQLRWRVEASDPTAREVTIEQAPLRPAGDVVAARRVSPTTLEVTVRPTALVQRYGHPPRPSMSTNLHERAEPACTAALAARWR